MNMIDRIVAFDNLYKHVHQIYFCDECKRPYHHGKLYIDEIWYKLSRNCREGLCFY